MEYKEKIESVIDRYFNGALAEYREVVMAAMDAGKKLSAKITKIEKKGSFTKIAVSIYLVDF